MKTRKSARKQQGGAVSKLPPLPSGFSWDLKFLGGHGGLTGDVFVVPPNTYIMNVATAGRPCKKEGFHIENTLFDLQNNHSKAERILKSMLSEKSLLKNSGSNEYLFNEKNVMGDTEEVYGSRSKKQKTISFYEPGDLMPDNQISVFNDNFPFFVMGLYDAPVKYSVLNAFEVLDDDENDSSTKSRIRKYSEHFTKKLKEMGITYDSLNEDQKHNLFTEINMDNFMEDHKKLLNRPLNLLQNFMFDSTGNPKRHRFKLSEIVGTDILGPVPVNTIRVLFVKACRGVMRLPGENDATTKMRTNRVRRWSIASRQRFLPTAKAEPAATGGGTAKAEPAAIEEYHLRKQRLRLDLLLQIQTQFNKIGIKNKIIDDAIVKLQAGKTFNLEALYNELLKIQKEHKVLHTLTTILI